MRATSAYLILGTLRSGSTLLCRALESTNLAGSPREYFRPEGRFWARHGAGADPATYVHRLLRERASANGVFGAKVSWRHLLHFDLACRALPRYHEKPLPDILSELLPGLRYVRITRRDKPRQAISFWKASQTGAWGRRAGTTNGPTQPPAFDFDGITKIHRMLEDHETRIDEFFGQAGVCPFTVVYEEFVDAYEETVRAVLQHLAIEVPKDFVIAPPPMARQADAETDAWVERYYQLMDERRRDADTTDDHLLDDPS
jgi:trehalose 2-sulfotransferase